jgi:hypothetical protein
VNGVPSIDEPHFKTRLHTQTLARRTSGGSFDTSPFGGGPSDRAWPEELTLFHGALSFGPFFSWNTSEGGNRPLGLS